MTPVISRYESRSENRGSQWVRTAQHWSANTQSSLMWFNLLLVAALQLLFFLKLLQLFFVFSRHKKQTLGPLTMNSLLSLLPFPSPSCHTSFPSSSKHGICLWAGWRFTHSAPVVVVRSIHDDRSSLRIWPRLHHHHHHRHHRNDSQCMSRESWSARRRAGAGVGDVPFPSSSSSFSGSEEELEVSEAPEQQEVCGTTVRWVSQPFEFRV